MTTASPTLRARSALRPVAMSSGPLSSAIDLAEFQKWLKNSKPGEKITYASGPALPRAAATVQLALEWQEGGLIRCHHVRSTAGWDYIAFREEAPVRVEGRSKATVRRALSDLGPDSPELRLFSWLKRCANMAMSCPTNQEVANAYDLKNAQAASYLFRTLRDLGGIAVEEPGHGLRRIVTIKETGLRTKGGVI